MKYTIYQINVDDEKNIYKKYSYEYSKITSSICERRGNNIINNFYLYEKVAEVEAINFDEAIELINQFVNQSINESEGQLFDQSSDEIQSSNEIHSSDEIAQIIKFKPINLISIGDVIEDEDKMAIYIDSEKYSFGLITVKIS